MTIINKPQTKEFDENFERIFRNKKASPPGGAYDGSMQTTEEDAKQNRKSFEYPPIENPIK